MKKLISAICFSVILIAACQKKDSAPASTSANSSSTSSTTGQNPTTTGNGTAVFDALFEIKQSRSKINGSYFQPFFNVQASLSVPQVTNEVYSIFNYQNMGVVKLNNITFKKDYIFVNNYTDSSFALYTAPYKWNISGSSAMSAFNFTATNAFPIAPNANPIPDSLSKTAGLTIPLSNSPHCDFVQLILTGPVGSGVAPAKIVSASATSIGFTAQELGVYQVGNGVLTLNFINDSLVTLNGKIVNFRSATGFMNPLFKIKS